MSLKITLKDHLACPVVLCDHCREPIEDARDGNVYYNPDFTNDGTTDMFFNHKRCARAFEVARDARFWHTWELADLLVYLPANLAYTQKDIEKRTERLAVLS
jgi:hypothetical protein